MGNLRQKHTNEEWNEMVNSTKPGFVEKRIEQQIIQELFQPSSSNKQNQMTAEEFNTKYKEYLEEGHYGLDIHIPSVIRYLDEVFQDLIKIPGFQYSQIKDKYNYCRFYTNLYEVLGNKVGAIISNEVERKVTMLMEAHYEHNGDWDATLMDGLEYESWDELYDDYVGEADLYEFVQWLKDNFQVPNKL